jgi:mono/diheme cytochrome c family protein
MRIKLVMVSVLVAAIAGTSTLAAQAPNAQGLYAQKCASCHGASGTPAPAMARSMGIPDFADARGVAAKPDSVLEASVAAGKGRTMPAYRGQLTPPQIHALVAYIKTLAKPAH